MLFTKHLRSIRFYIPYVLAAGIVAVTFFFALGGLEKGVFSSEVGFVAYSPNGIKGGAIVPASCESGDYHDQPSYGQACTSSANVCGQTNSGSIQCGGGCSASAPSNPPSYGQPCASSNSCGDSNYGITGCSGCSASAPAERAGYGNSCSSSQNACGQTNSGTIQCDGSCSASTPANPSTCTSAQNSCGLTNSGYLCSGSCSASVPADSSCPEPSIDSSVSSSSGSGSGGSGSSASIFINRGDSCRITWASTDTTSCTVTGPGVNTTGTSGSILTPALFETSVYTVSCNNGTVVTSSEEVTCRLTPEFEEI